MTISRELAELAASYNSGGLPGMRNRIINGDMRIDQRNAGASVSNFNALYLTDRFLGQTYRTAATAQRVTDAPTGFTNSLRYTNDSTGAAPSAAQSAAFIQAMEGFNVSDFGLGTASASTVTLSFWVKASVTGTYGVGFCNNGAQNWVSATRSYVATYSVSSANTWEYKTITLTLDTSGTWGTGSNVALAVVFDIGSGSNYNASSAGSWQTGAFSRVSGCVQLASTANATLAITGVQLEKGSTATSFDYRPYGAELALCYRYYRRFLNSGTTYTAIGVGANGSTTTLIRWGLTLDIPMRTAPSVSFTNCVAWDGTVGGNVVVNAPYNSVNTIDVDINTSGLTGSAVGRLAKVLMQSNGFVELGGAEL
jgi:hypothetical protein